jgi:two-component system OmpR family sensor kinase/two-component system sensor histidine kinase BaeS
MGCLFALFVLGVSAIIILVFGLVAYLLGVLQIPGTLTWVIPLGVTIFLLSFGFLAWGGGGLRHASLPFSELLEAAGRVAEGDYSARVTEHGPPEVRSLVSAFNHMASRLQLTNEQRRNLLADVTHELRTPLTVMQGNLEGMLDGVYAADEKRLKSLLEETQVLARLVDDLRTLALAESGTLQLKKEPTDLAVLVNETVAAFGSQADAAGVRLGADVMPDAPLMELDHERMREVLSNLIANALRYTSSGGSIHVRHEMASADGSRRVTIAIQDTGVGIRPEDLPHVFDRFYKARDSGGMGLGLSIARHLVEAHGGAIEAQSNFGEGTTMRITLPV